MHSATEKLGVRVHMSYSWLKKSVFSKSEKQEILCGSLPKSAFCKPSKLHIPRRVSLGYPRRMTTRRTNDAFSILKRTLC